MRLLSKFFPILEVLSNYSSRLFKDDLIAGLTVGVMLVPQGMAYAFLAGMPPIYGLYSGLIPLFIYAILGTSRQMSIGPVAVSALLVLAGVSQLEEPGTSEYISLVITAGLMIGILQVFLGFVRMGFLVNFLSHPVLAGFTTAAAIIIAASQLKDLLGFPIPRFEETYETIFYAIEHIHQTNWIAVVMCLTSIFIIFYLKKVNKNIPGALLVVIVGTILVSVFQLNNYGLEIVGTVPEGLPDFAAPRFDMETIERLLPTVLTVTIIGIVESMSIAKVMESKNQNYTIRPNQELFALGFSKIFGSFFQSIPTSGSFTRSAINNEAGSKSGVSSIVTVILIALTLVFLMPLFYFLPKAILAAIVLLAVKSLFEYEEALFLWKTHRPDFWMMMITFVATLALGIEIGVATGVVLSLLAVLYRTSKPHYAILGQIPNTIIYRNINRFENAIQHEGILIMRFDEQLYFGNATFFKDLIKQLANEHKPSLLILDGSDIQDIDSSGLHALHEAYHYLHQRNIEFYISGFIGPVRDRIDQAGFIDKIGADNFFDFINDAVETFKDKKY